MSNQIWNNYWNPIDSSTTRNYSPADPIKARWHLVQDTWALVDDADGEVLASVHEERGIWIMRGDGADSERYISEAAAKKRAEEYAEVDEIIVPGRQNSAGIP